VARILLVDDDADFRRATRRMLEHGGHEVIEAADGKSALERYAANPADLILTDVYMPGVDGIEAIIRLQQEFPNARIIATSGGGYRDKEDVLTTAARLGARRTLPKPVDRKALLDAVAEVLHEDHA
jgi:CheY-like chemotaxis protein